MLDEKLKKVLTRKMTAGDYCYQRFFSYMPLLEREYCCYMIDNHQYNQSTVILAIIKDWCNERNKTFLKNTIFMKK